MLSQTVDYALRAVVHLASERPKACTNEKIAEATRVPRQYLSKVMHSLVRSGIVNSQRGPNGGFTLNKPDRKLTVYEVVQAVDPIQRIRECPLGLKTHGPNLCPLHRRLDAAMALVEQAFRESTVEEILAEPSSHPLCEVPPSRSKR
jgi:Rrf2 family transcriptional regulator, nitric oxide-sensitive transcriptional repressor